MRDCQLIKANTLHGIPLADESVHCCVTSPPYFGLRDYGVAGQLGMEKLHDCAGWATGQECGECFVCHMVQVGRHVRRVLRKDGTFWLNLGDSYASAWSCSRRSTIGNGAPTIDERANRMAGGLKEKDLMMVPARVALALQADGWYLRTDVIWAKNNPMPESVTDRPTRSHEYIFLLTKSERYFYDAEAVKEKSVSTHGSGNGFKRDARLTHRDANGARGNDEHWEPNGQGRNRRTVWEVSTQPYSEAHFATFPPKLIEPCILAGTSERGCCPECGGPWARQVERTGDEDTSAKGSRFDCGKTGTRTGGDRTQPGVRLLTKATGWQPTCTCPPHEPEPCTVLDPFNGAGTSGLVALKHGRRYVGLDLNDEYLAMARRRIEPVASQGRLMLA